MSPVDALRPLESACQPRAPHGPEQAGLEGVIGGLNTFGKEAMRTPLEAFDRFLELTPNQGALYEVRREEYLELIDSFLANPAQHREHVRLVTEAAAAAWLLEVMPWLNAKRWPFGLSKLAPRLNWSQSYLEKVERLKAELRASAQPGQFDIDLLPSRLVDTPTEWNSYQLHLIEVRVAVHPFHGLVPDKVSVSLDVHSDSTLRFIDCLPTTEFADQGEHEVSVTREGKFVRSATLEASAKLGAAAAPLSVGIGSVGTLRSEAASTEATAYRFRYQSISPKTISSAVAGQARWELLRTPTQIPLGGLKLMATVLAPKNVEECTLGAKLEVHLTSWGVVPLTLSRTINLSARRCEPESAGG